MQEPLVHADEESE